MFENDGVDIMRREELHVRKNEVNLNEIPK
jgi:hypothetical protein